MEFIRLNTKQFIIFGIIGILLMLVLWFQSHKKNLKIDQLNFRVENLEDNIDDLNDDINYLKEEKSTLLNQIQQKENLIFETYSLVSKIQEGVTTLQVKGESDRSQIDKMINEIESYKKAIETLKSEKSELIKQKEQLQKDLDSQKIRKEATLEEKNYYELQKEDLIGQLIDLEAKIEEYENASDDASNAVHLFVKDKYNRNILMDNINLEQKEVLGKELLLEVKFNSIWLTKTSYGRKVLVKMVKDGSVAEQTNEYTIDPKNRDVEITLGYFLDVSKKDTKGSYEVDLLSNGKSILEEKFRFVVKSNL